MLVPLRGGALTAGEQQARGEESRRGEKRRRVPLHFKSLFKFKSQLVTFILPIQASVCVKLK